MLQVIAWTNTDQDKWRIIALGQWVKWNKSYFTYISHAIILSIFSDKSGKVRSSSIG